ncbi:MAG: glycosyltransferase family 9 protein [Bacteroidota bacterium]
MKILVVQIGRLGDVILLTPLLRALKQKFPQSEIHFLAGSRNAIMLKGSPHVSKVFTYEKNPFTLIPLLLKLRREKYDLWIDPKDHYSTESSLLASFSGAKKKIGCNKKGGNIFDTHVEYSDEMKTLHVTERNLLAVQFLKTAHHNIRPELPLLPESEKFVEEFLKENAGMDSRLRGNDNSGENLSVLRTSPLEKGDNRAILKKVVVNISASTESRYWQQEKWTELFKNDVFKNAEIFLTFVPEDRAKAEELLKATPALKLFRSRSIWDVVSLVKAADVVITPDTAVVHIAAAFDKPIVALFPAQEWNFYKFRPLSTHAEELFKEGRSIPEIPVSEVVVAVERIFAVEV